jgi:hypothetical protein
MRSIGLNQLHVRVHPNEDAAMNDRQSAELIQAISELRQRYPQWRLGQLIANVAGWADHDVWDVEDEQFLAAAREHLQNLPKRAASA